MKTDFLLFLLFCLPAQAVAWGIVRWQSLPLTSSYIYLESKTESGATISCHGAKGSESIALTGEESICLAKSDTAQILISTNGEQTDLIRFYWEQEFSANADAVVAVNDTILFALKTDDMQDNSQLFEQYFSPPIQLHSIKIRQSSAVSGQISVGDIHMGSEPVVKLPQLQYGSLIVSELMIDPEPQVYLPKCEYVELANTTDSAVELSHFSLVINGKGLALPAYELPSMSCVVLHGACYGDTANFRSAALPSLSNEGFDLAIFSGQQLIYSMYYDIHAFSSDVKSDGGWSLEKMSILSLSNTDYAYSHDERGGSPGYVGITPPGECSAPFINNIYTYDGHHLAVEFSSQMDSASIAIADVVTDNVHADSIRWNAPFYDRITVFFQTGFSDIQKHKLTIHSMKARCGTQSQDAAGYWAVPEKIVSGIVRFNEIMFDPQEESSEYIEIRNTSSKAVDLADLHFATFNDDNTIQALYPLAEKPKVLFPDSIAVLSKNFSDYAELFECACPDNYVAMNSFPSLTNGGGKLGLYSRSLVLIDEVDYSPSVHSRSISDSKGISIELTANGWASSPARCGYGSPGCKNSESDNSSTVSDVLCSDFFSPNNDGEEDVLSISFTAEPNSTADVIIFSEFGNLTVQLAQKTLIAGPSQLVWDGYAEDQDASAGIYIVMVTIYSEDGDRKILKKPTVLLR